MFHDNREHVCSQRVWRWVSWTLGFSELEFSEIEYSPRLIHILHFTKKCTGAKDKLSFKILHFTAQILRVDIQTKVLYFHDFSKISARGKRYQSLQTGS